MPTSLLLPKSEQWILGAKTGLYGITGRSNGFYRPCAFFLEPAHMFLYAFPILCMLLFSPDMNKNRIGAAAFITAGMLLSTSGMGSSVAIGIWCAYFALYNSKYNPQNSARLKNLISVKTIATLTLVLVALIIAYFKVEVFRNSILRIFTSKFSGTSTAIDGRTKGARKLVADMVGKELLFGVTENVEDIKFHLPGFYATLYKYGLTGIFLSYWFYVSGIIRLRGAGFWVSLIILVISFFSAHTHGTFYMIYYLIVLMNSYHMEGLYKEKEWRKNSHASTDCSCV